MPTPTQPLLSVIAQIQTLAGALDGIVSAPVDPTETVNQYPAAVSFVTDLGSTDLFNGVLRRFPTIRTLIFGNRTSLPQDVSSMTPYGDTFPMVLWGDPTLANTVMTITGLTATFGVIEYAGANNYVGWTFNISVKLEDPLS